MEAKSTRLAVVAPRDSGEFDGAPAPDERTPLMRVSGPPVSPPSGGERPAVSARPVGEHPGEHLRVSAGVSGERVGEHPAVSAGVSGERATVSTTVPLTPPSERPARPAVPTPGLPPTPRPQPIPDPIVEPQPAPRVRQVSAAAAGMSRPVIRRRPRAQRKPQHVGVIVPAAIVGLGGTGFACGAFQSIVPLLVVIGGVVAVVLVVLVAKAAKSVAAAVAGGDAP